MAKMAGPFVPLPKEIIELLDPEPTASLKYYVKMLSLFFLETVEDTDTEWVGAYIHRSEREILKTLGGSGHLRANIFPRWCALGLLEKKDGCFYLPKYYRKSEAYIQPIKMQKDLRTLKESYGKMQQSQLEMEKTIQNLLGVLSKSQEVITIPRAGDRRETRLSPARNAPLTGAAVSLLSKDQEKISLSVMNKVISIFYKGIGQNRISGQVRGNAQKVFRKLLTDNFLPYEIAFAVDWTIIPENVPTKIKSFAIVGTTISQALAQREEQEEAAKRRQLAEEAAEAEQQNRNYEAEQRDRLNNVKNSLAPEKRKALREKALEQLHAAGVYNEGMITEVLIGIQENAILRESDDAVTYS